MNEPEVLDMALPHLQMRALAWGPRDGRLALCVHGFPDSAWSWRLLAPMLAEHGYRVVAPFTRGYAPTPVPADRDYTVGALMYDVLAVHSHLGEPKDAVLIGHDWGAIAANGIAAMPNSPFALNVSLAVPSFGAVSRSRGSVLHQIRLGVPQLRKSWYVFFFQIPGLAERILPAIVRKLWRDWGPRDDYDEDVVNTLSALPTRAHRAAAVGYYRFMVQFRRSAPPYDKYNRFRFGTPMRPTLHVHGADDGALNVGYTEFLQQALPAGSRLHILANAGHFMQSNNPQHCARSYWNF